MSGAYSVQADLVRGTIAEVKQLTVDRLKRLLKRENLPVSGVKSELQTRLIAHIYDCDRRNDQDQLRRIRDAARGAPPSSVTSSSQYTNAPNPNPYPSPYSAHTPASSASPQYYNSPTPRLPAAATSAMSGGGYSASRITFKTSPFYSIQRQLGGVTELKAREQTRDTARVSIQLDDALSQRLCTDPSCRVFVFCAAESFESAWKPVDIAFPTHAELRCNQEEVKANLKGLKKKPGSTSPADITPFLRKKYAFPNTLEMVYALTTKKFYLIVNVVQKRSIDSLVEDLKRGKYMSKERVIREMQSAAKDDDIVATSSNMSLKDPVQMTRIQTPCRGMLCKHNECFDAAVYLALQEQAPTWTCPICNKAAAWENLVYDLYVQDILRNTKSDAEQVTVDPDGTWHSVKAENDDNDSSNPFGTRADSDDDDELVEITDLAAPRTISPIKPRPSHDLIRTPSLNGSFMAPSRPSPYSPAQSLNSSTPSLQQQSQSRKRPRDEVIDLTLSDDDDDSSQPPVSRLKHPFVPSQNSADPHRSLGQTLLDSGSNSQTSSSSIPYRFSLPPPPRTDSPGRYYDFDQFTTRY